MQETVLGTTQLIKSQGDNPEVKCRMSKCRAVQNINEMIINSIENVFGLHNLWFWEWRMPHAMQLWLTICVWTLDLVRGYWTKHADRLGKKKQKKALPGLQCWEKICLFSRRGMIIFQSTGEIVFVYKTRNDLTCELAPCRWTLFLLIFTILYQNFHESSRKDMWEGGHSGYPNCYRTVLQLIML